MARGLVDTSVFVALESGRPLTADRLPGSYAISPITLGELQAGVLAAADQQTRAERLLTLDMVADIELLPIDEIVANSWALLRVHLAESGRRLNVNDLWIAATAHANGVPVYTQDDDFRALEDAPGLAVVIV